MPSLYNASGVTMCFGAVRHPLSQGAAERFSQMLLTLKVLNTSNDWAEDLVMLLYFYRNTPYSTISVSPMQAKIGWQPRRTVINSSPADWSFLQWTHQLQQRASRMYDFLERNCLQMTSSMTRYSHLLLAVPCCFAAHIAIRSASQSLRMDGQC